MQLKNVSPFLLGWYRLGKTPKLGFQKAYLILNRSISFRKGHPYYTPKLQASAQRLFSRCCLLLAGSKISLSPLLPVSILIDSLLPSRKRLVRPLLCCCILWSSASVCVFRIAGIRRWFPIEMSAPGFGRPIWLVQLSLLEAPAVVRLRTPRPRISHSQSIFFISYFIFLSCIFLSIYRSASCR